MLLPRAPVAMAWLSLPLLMLPLSVLPTSAVAEALKDIGEHGAKASAYYKWQRNPEDVKLKAEVAKKKMAATLEATAKGRSESERHVIKLQKAMERKERYKIEAIEHENFEEAGRLRDEIEEIRTEILAARAETESCDSDSDAVAEDDVTDPATATGAPIPEEEESPRTSCPPGYYDHDRNSLTPCEPVNDQNLEKLNSVVETLNTLSSKTVDIRTKVAVDEAAKSVQAIVSWATDTGFAHFDVRDAKKKGGSIVNGEIADVEGGTAGGMVQYEASQLHAGHELLAALDAVDKLDLTTPTMTNKEELAMIKQKAELSGMLGHVLINWLGGHSNSTLRDLVMPPSHMPVMTKVELQTAQAKSGKLKAKSAEQLYGWMCPGCPMSRGEENSRGRFVLAIGRDVEARLPTLFIGKKQRATIDGHGHRWARTELITSQHNERRFTVKDHGRLKLIRLHVVGASLSYVGHGAAVNVESLGRLEVSECAFRANIARSQGGAISVAGQAEISKSEFIANYAYGAGGAINVAYNAPGAPPRPPSLQVTACRFVDNESKMKGGGDAIAFGKGSPKVGKQVDNRAEMTIAA